MIPAANRYTAVLDASVLFPNMKRDLLLRFFEADLYRARWTEQIQQEWLTNAIAKYADKEDQLRRTDALMREHFEDAWVDSDLPPEAPSFITRVCGFGFHILRRQFGQARRARSPQIAQALDARQRVFGCPAMNAV